MVASAKDRLDDAFEAELLVAYAAGVERSHLYAHPEDCLSLEQVERAHNFIRRRQLGTPIAHLLGQREFYGRVFKVTPNVLIPRPETEGIVDEVHALPLCNQAKVVDVGTGSGCLGLTLAMEYPTWTVCTTDISNEAIEVCQENRLAHRLSNVAIYQGDLLEPLNGQMFDLIVANLPYVAPNDPHLTQGDLPHEPQQALVAEMDGLAVIEKLIAQAPSHLIRPGHLIVEHGFDQQAQIIRRLRQHGFDLIKPVKDLSGKPRLVVASISH